jgi:hypothetical protein
MNATNMPMPPGVPLVREDGGAFAPHGPRVLPHERHARAQADPSRDLPNHCPSRPRTYEPPGRSGDTDYAVE